MGRGERAIPALMVGVVSSIIPATTLSIVSTRTPAALAGANAGAKAKLNEMASVGKRQFMWALGCLVTSLLMSVGSACGGKQQRRATTVRIADVELRASSLVTPTYPEYSARHHVEGLAVIEARVGSNGRVLSTKVLQSPNVDIATAAERAARMATFEMPKFPGKGDVDGVAKFYFYFRFRDGVPKVLLPSQLRHKVSGYR